MVMCPKDWTTYDFGSYFSILPNNTFPRAVESSSGSVANIHYGDVLVRYRETIDNRTDIPRLVPSVEFKTEAFLQPNDVIFADTAEDETVGKCTQLISAKTRVVAGLHTIPCRPNAATAPGFLGYYLNSALFHDQLIPYITGIKVSSISKSSILKTTLTVPSVPEQRAIAEVLSGFDEHLANLDELIVKKKAIRDGAIDELLTGRTRIADYQDPWVTRSSRELFADVITGGTPSTTIAEYWDGGIPWLSSTEIHQRMVSRPTRYISEEGLANSSAQIAPAGSVLIALAGQGKTRGTSAYLTHDMALNQSLAGLVTNETELHRVYLLYAVTRRYEELRGLSSGDGGRGGLNKTLLWDLRFTLPSSLEEQRAIAEILSGMDEEIRLLEEERVKVERLKLGAMDDLLTGRVRLPIEEEAA